MPSKRELLIGTYKAFNARDIDGALAMMHPEVDWPNGMEGGRMRGRSNVRDYWQRQWGMINPHVEPVRFEDDDMGQTVVDVHQVIRDLAGTVLKDEFVQHVYSIRNNLIESMDIRKQDGNPTSRNPN